MSNELNLAGEPLAAAVTWFLDSFITPVVDAGKVAIKRKKTKFDWGAAAERYRASLIKDYGKIRIFGAVEEVELKDIFTDVIIYETVLARIPYDFEALRQQLAQEQRRMFELQAGPRVNGVALVKGGKNLFILGKPGAGKTTFLKYLTVQAASYNLKRVPIFVSLNEWANSPYADPTHPQLMPFIVQQFAICHFADAEPFIEQLLNSGQALVLFDGLDEVKQEQNQRRQLISLLRDFSRQYDCSQCLITCRIAASDYTFAGFRDVQVADFTAEQIQTYARLWFGAADKSFAAFSEELDKPENAGVRELCTIPLLLSMICLYFRLMLRFPPNRAELYEGALNALITGWDASREIQRDELPRGENIYRELSTRRKEQLFAEIAHRTFSVGDYVFRRRDLTRWIESYLAMLPNVKLSDDIDVMDATAVLKAIEAQHGIFVERAQDIYSFAHLTFHEYFTARYLFEHQAQGSIRSLIEQHLMDNRWREIFLLTSSLLDRAGADDFFYILRQTIDRFLTDDFGLVQFLRWATMRANEVQLKEEQRVMIRLAYIFLAHALYLSRARTHPLARALNRALDLSSDLSRTRARSRGLAHILDHNIALTLNLALDLDRDNNIVIDHTIAINFANSLSINFGFDYALYCSWAMAALFAQSRLESDWSLVSDALLDYPTVVVDMANLAQRAGLFHVLQQLSALRVPAPKASAQSWQEFANHLFRLLQERELTQEWQLTSTQIGKLGDYFAANELLVQCLKGAVVTDRQAILAGLLSPSAEQNPATE